MKVSSFTAGLTFGLAALLALPSIASAQNNIVSGSAQMVLIDQIHPNGNEYDQVLLTGAKATLRADSGQILRCSFVDENGDIVQAEFSGPGEFTIELDSDSVKAAAPAAKYNQPGVNYVTGRPVISITGSTKDTYVTIFTVGKGTAVNQTLFKDGEVYDGIADVRLLQVTGNEIGAIRTGNTRFGGPTGMTGILAPDTNVLTRAILHDIKASGSATPVLQIGADSDLSLDSGSVLLAGGDLQQPNGAAIDVTSGSNGPLLSIVTVSNVRSSGDNITRQTVSGSVTFVDGGKGTLLIDGEAIFDHDTGGTSGSFSANFQDLLKSENSPFDFDGGLDLTWEFSGGNQGTWFVSSVMTTQGLTTTSKMSGTYNYVVNGDGSQLTFTMVYDKIEATVTLPGGLPPSTTTILINASSNPPMPKSIKVVATQTGPSSGTYEYTLTWTDGREEKMSGNYSPNSPLGMPTGLN